MRLIALLSACGIITLFTLPAALTAQDHDTHEHAGAALTSPYTELMDREIKALSGDEVEALLAGEGMGFALSAELNSYPGPRHVLELRDELELSETQTRDVEAIMSVMTHEARRLGEHIVELERALDAAFSSHAITIDELTPLTTEIAVLRGRLRAVHLRAHLETTTLLTMQQRHQYQVLRGYMS